MEDATRTLLSLTLVFTILSYAYPLMPRWAVLHERIDDEAYTIRSSSSSTTQRSRGR